MQNLSKDIEAEGFFLLPEDGGRKGPIFSGFRPQFIYDGHDWDASLHFVTTEIKPKGKPIRVFFHFVSPECHLGKLFPGKTFQLRDGNRVIANGKVLRLIDLENSAMEIKRKWVG